MSEVSIVGIGLEKCIFQLHGAREDGYLPRSGRLHGVIPQGQSTGLTASTRFSNTADWFDPWFWQIS